MTLTYPSSRYALYQSLVYFSCSLEIVGGIGSCICIASRAMIVYHGSTSNTRVDERITGLILDLYEYNNTYQYVI